MRLGEFKRYEKYKDSGVEWIGEVPEHWKIVQLRNVISKFIDYRGKTPDKKVDGIPLITARNVKDGIINLEISPEFIAEEDYEGWMVRGLPDVGDVILTTEAPLGEVAQIEEKYVALAQRIILFKTDKRKISNEFLKYYFLSSSGKSELQSRGTGSTAIGIKASKLREISIIVPPPQEQDQIIKSLEIGLGEFTNIVLDIQTQIEKLKEYRQSLISEAVTGKVMV